MQANNTAGVCPIQYEHWYNDTSFSFSHIQLNKFAWIIDQKLSNFVLDRANLQPSFDFKDKPLRMISNIPNTKDLKFSKKLLEISTFGKTAQAIYFVLKHTKEEEHKYAIHEKALCNR
mmetsp:Transcript_60341/g.110778  ORF Transcript_60341/g.110778 Transcript_60341/m.110778 type:complete len:118 (+) Transcript_60341:326-679(+)